MGRTSNARERMLEAARTLIWRQSYGAVTMDAICTAANVHKGSFYHFFDSKADVAAAAFAALWEYERFRLDQIFAARLPALERLGNYFAFLYEQQVELRRQHGRVVGSPFTALASELGPREEAIGLQVARWSTATANTWSWCCARRRLKEWWSWGTWRRRPSGCPPTWRAACSRPGFTTKSGACGSWRPGRGSASRARYPAVEQPAKHIAPRTPHSP